ncbi:MAG TPA: hypothetical protein VMV49_07185 [Candidatus Deferrimicrobium sp.]|nr:hypothetical protein [Candidatus Deferrimicrobium sp.]
MSWEESQRKEQVFRKTKLNREVILKMIESEHGKSDLIFSLRNNDSITELSLTLNEWKSIISFLNKTSDRIINEISKIKNVPLAEPIAVPIVEPVTEQMINPIATPIIQHSFSPEEKLPAEKLSESAKPTVQEQEEEFLAASKGALIEASKTEPPIELENQIGSPEDFELDETFKELETEIGKVSHLEVEAIPVIPAEDVIKEVFQPLIKKSVKEEEISLEDSVSKSSIESISEKAEEKQDEPIVTEVTSDEVPEDLIADILTEAPEVTSDEVPEDLITEDKDESSLNTNVEEHQIPEKIAISFPTPPEIPKIPKPSTRDFNSLLTPPKPPKIPSFELTEHEFLESEIERPEIILPKPEEPKVRDEQEIPSLDSHIFAVDLLDELKSEETPVQPPLEPIGLGKDDEFLSSDEKEAKILAAMEEVATLMPPGPAKKFVEEMMLKRTSKSDSNNPRIPQRINSNSEKKD